MLFGHRNDPIGYAHHLNAIDARLPEVMATCGHGDLMILTADHGNDPTTPSTDHSREQVPLLAWRGDLPTGLRLGVRTTFADVAATIAEALGVVWSGPGKSFWTTLATRRGAGEAVER